MQRKGAGVPDDRGVPEESNEEPAGEPLPDDEFASLVLDDDFVRGGTYEPPARTRLAIARYGDRQTSWRHGGGLSVRRSADTRTTPSQSKPKRPRATSGPVAPSPLLAKLPIIASVVVVAVFAYLMFG